MSINEERSYTEYTVTEPTTEFAIGFDDYMDEDKDTILVTHNGILVESLGYAVLRKNKQTVTITPAITEGTVRLTRETDIDEPFHKFTAGALFSAKSVDQNFEQIRHSQQEVRDGFVFLEYNTNGIVQASKDATAQAQAATVEATSAAVRAEGAATTAVQAVGSLQGVVDAATTATTNANTATSEAVLATATATQATTLAQGAATSALAAQVAASTAASNAEDATVDTLAATGRANDAANVVADLVVGKVRAQDVSTVDGNTQEDVNQELLESSRLLMASEYLFKPSDSTDHTQELKDTLEYCFINKLRAKPVGEFSINDKIVIKGSFDGSRATFTTRTAIPVAVELSTGDGENPVTIVRLADEETVILPNVINGTKPVTGWLGQGIGVRYVNVQNTKIVERLVENFTIGVQATAYTQGCGYNTVTAGYLRNNKINRQFTVGDASGFTNRWDLIGGRYFHSSAEGTETAGVMHFDVVPNAVGNIINDINHFGGSLEGITQQYHLRLGGSNINLFGIRLETKSASGGIKVHLDSAGLAGQGEACGLHYGRGINATAINVTRGAQVANPSFTINSTQGQSSKTSIGTPQMFQSTSSSNQPSIAVFAPTTSSSADAITKYSMALSANKLMGKKESDLFNRVEINGQDGNISFGDGTSAPTLSIVRRGAGALGVTANLLPSTKESNSLGISGFEWREVFAAKYMFTSTVGAFYGAGTPEGVVAAGVGSTYHRTDGAAGASLYVKESGAATANGWVAK